MAINTNDAIDANFEYVTAQFLSRLIHRKNLPHPLNKKASLATVAYHCLRVYDHHTGLNFMGSKLLSHVSILRNHDLTHERLVVKSAYFLVFSPVSR